MSEFKNTNGFKNRNDTIIIDRIKDYSEQRLNGQLILTPIAQHITEDELNMTALAYSSVLECFIKKGDDIISAKTKYKPMLVDIYKVMLPQKILQTSKFNFKLTKEDGENGYHWCKDIHMSFQNKSATGTLKEIINMIKVNNFTIDLTIKLETGRIIHFKMD